MLLKSHLFRLSFSCQIQFFLFASVKGKGDIALPFLFFASLILMAKYVLARELLDFKPDMGRC